MSLVQALKYKYEQAGQNINRAHCDEWARERLKMEHTIKQTESLPENNIHNLRNFKYKLVQIIILFKLHHFYIKVHKRWKISNPDL